MNILFMIGGDMMLKKFVDTLAGPWMTAIGGIMLALSLALKLSGVDFFPDPAWVALFICGVPLLYLAIWRIIHNKGISKISSALLISIAMVAAVCIGDLFAAGEVAFIMAIGAILEDMTVERSKKGLKKLVDLAPRQGRRIDGDAEEMIDAGSIAVGDVLRVLPGETVPADGTVLKGVTSMDQSVMTGESLPVDKTAGNAVFGGTMNLFGTVDIIATRAGDDGTLQKMIDLVRKAEEEKAPMQRLADRWASWLVPLALSIAVIAFFATGDIVRAVTVLVVFCPCALVLATPTAIMAAIGQATKHGVIIKSGDALERLGKADCVAFDKTGTLTRGDISVSDIVSFDVNVPDNEILRLAASVESLSEHPLAKEIVARAKADGVIFASGEMFAMSPGNGVSALVGEDRVSCGKAEWLVETGDILYDSIKDALAHFRGQGKATVAVSVGGRVVGAMALSDTVRDASANTVCELKAMGVSCVLLTGDHGRTADRIAGQTGITDVRSELLPEGKVMEIRRMQNEGKVVCMVGDGVNDAPALKAADVSIAMGTMGSDIAVDAADIALTGDDISKIVYLKKLSEATVKTIKFCIGLSLVINFFAVSASVLGMLTPTTGALVHNIGSVLVVAIAGLLYDRDFEKKGKQILPSRTMTPS